MVIMRILTERHFEGNLLFKLSIQKLIISTPFSFCCFETGPHYAALTGLELTM